jgi:hypothetical protein
MKGMAMTIVENRALITGGVDTHLNFHVAAAIDANGGTLSVETFPVGRKHYGELLAWLVGFGALDKVGVEGTGSYGARFGPASTRGRDCGGRGGSTEPADAKPAGQV